MQQQQQHYSPLPLRCMHELWCQKKSKLLCFVSFWIFFAGCLIFQLLTLLRLRLRRSQIAQNWLSEQCNSSTCSSYYSYHGMAVNNNGASKGENNFGRKISLQFELLLLLHLPLLPLFMLMLAALGQILGTSTSYSIERGQKTPSTNCVVIRSDNRARGRGTCF